MNISKHFTHSLSIMHCALCIAAITSLTSAANAADVSDVIAMHNAQCIMHNEWVKCLLMFMGCLLVG